MFKSKVGIVSMAIGALLLGAAPAQAGSDCRPRGHGISIRIGGGYHGVRISSGGYHGVRHCDDGYRGTRRHHHHHRDRWHGHGRGHGRSYGRCR